MCFKSRRAITGGGYGRNGGIIHWMAFSKNFLSGTGVKDSTKSNFSDLLIDSGILYYTYVRTRQESRRPNEAPDGPLRLRVYVGGVEKDGKWYIISYELPEDLSNGIVGEKDFLEMMHSVKLF